MEEGVINTNGNWEKDNEEAKANGATVVEGNVLTDEDIEGIGSILNGG